MLTSPYKQLQIVKSEVNMRRFNKIERQRKIKLASLAGFIYFPRLVKHEKSVHKNPS